MNCRSCGNTRLVPGSNFCPICGARLEPEKVHTTNVFDQLPAYLRANHVAMVLPFCKSKIYQIMNDPESGVIQHGKNKLWPKERFIAYLEALDNIS